MGTKNTQDCQFLMVSQRGEALRVTQTEQPLVRIPLDGSYNVMAVKSGSMEAALASWMKSQAQMITSANNAAKICIRLLQLPMGKSFHPLLAYSNISFRRTYSLYLPVQESKSPLSSPMPAPKKHSKRSKDSKEVQLDANNLLKGRRSTMNSRETAFEEEQLRIAIEESKREGGADSEATSPRKGKRSRSESEE